MYERIYCKEQLDAFSNYARLGEIDTAYAPSLCLAAGINIFLKGNIPKKILLQRLDGKQTRYLVIPKG